MVDAQAANPLARRPPYIFDLPSELLYSLTIKTTSAQSVTPQAEPKEEAFQRPRQTPAAEEHSTPSSSCNLCGTSHTSVQEQRQHVRSDFHRYNLKLQVKGLPAVDEATFVTMIGDLDESISGSDSSDSDQDEVDAGKESTLSALLKRQAKLSHPGTKTEEDGGTSAKVVTGNAPIYWFTSPSLGEDNVAGFYRAIFSQEEQDTAPSSLLEAIKKKQVRAVSGKHSGNAAANGTAMPGKDDPHYFMCMIGGGHFAAMIVSLVPELRKGPGGVEERHPIVLKHKTFHRYTTRRKQGGSQSANDNSKGNAHSVGSSIRRANEAALELDIRAVLQEWKPLIDTAELIFVRATGSQNRRILFGPYDGQVLSSRDKRLRGFPFSTRRATQGELLRSFLELTKVKISTLVEAVPQPAKPKEAPPKSIKPKLEAPRLSKQDEVAQLHTSQLENFIKRSKAPALLLYLSKNELSPDFSLFPPGSHHHAPTILHLASSTNSAAVVTALLLKAKANPTVLNAESKTPYDLAGDQKTRDAFRVARHQLGESSYDWDAAHVATGMSQKEADERAEKDKTTIAATEAERRKAGLERLEQEQDQRSANKMERKGGAGKSLSAAAEKSGAEKREEEMRGLTPEMRMRLERERRARAAEERIKKMQAGSRT
jgi:hypothetical protein